MTSADLRRWLDAFSGKPAASVLQQLDERLQTCLKEINANPDAMLEALFLKAIRDQKQPQTGSHEHLYLQRFEIPQIVLFDLLINQMPFVVMSHAITNRAMANRLKTAQTAVVIDVGIGRGIQLARLLDELIQTGTRLQKLMIVGVEPFADALAHAETLIRQTAEKAGFSVDFVALHSLVENLAPDALARVRPAHYDQLIVNSSLTVHHLPTTAQRQTFFRQIRALEPDLLLLTEPNSDHLEPNWHQRTLNAYDHYRAVFGVIDDLAIDTMSKNGLKMFFGREIDDVVGNPEENRFERHQEAAQWVRYLQESGFRLISDFDIPTALPPTPITLRTHPGGFLALEYLDFNVLSLFQSVVG